jgi:membrane-bound serine protease (ClpP class)
MEILAAYEPSWGLIVLLLVAGVLFSIAEIFVPSGGMLLVLTLGAFAGAVVLAFFKGETPGVVVLLATVLLAPVIVLTAIRAWPRTPLARRLILKGPQGTGKAGDLAHLAEEDLIGQVGVSKTMLRPAGKMVLEDRVIDCVTEGDLVPAGRTVRIIAVQGVRVVVRAAGEEKTV